MIRKATIKDIAKIAGVSATAVSMALNNRPGVSEKMRQKIFKISKKLGYQPNYAAITLISKRSHTIGLIISNITDPFYPELALGVEEKTNEAGYSLLLANTEAVLEMEKKALDTLHSRGVDGIILATATKDDPNIRQLVEDRIPFVLVNRFSMDPALENKMDCVVVDNFACGYDAIKHLYRLGHDRVAVIAGNSNTSTASYRTKGGNQAVNDLGMDTDPKLYAECGYIREQAYKATKQFIQMKNRPTAIFAHDDHMAIGVREAILESGLRIPEDIALVGVDDIEMASLSGVDLTTVSQKMYEMGAIGVKILLDKIEKDTRHMVSKVVLESKLIIRKSCGYHLKGYVR